MDYFDAFKPYSPERRGNLEGYLREHDGSAADNLFSGPEWFQVMRDKGYLVPGSTVVRVNQSPIPDIAYVVNEKFMLQSSGPGHANMSCMGAPEGVYDPVEALKDKIWSVTGLDFVRIESKI